MEDKYIALLHVMRELLLVHWLLEELSEALQFDRDGLSTISIAWENNKGALTLATNPLPCMTPHSKHIAVEYH
eukprot:15365461-Ditylum_brightwellii.AAC.1